jgi:hypothetical protein
VQEPWHNVHVHRQKKKMGMIMVVVVQVHSNRIALEQSAANGNALNQQ